MENTHESTECTIQLIQAEGDITDREVRSIVPTFHRGYYIASYDPIVGLGSLVATRDRRQAMRFKSQKEAFQLWTHVLPSIPLRPDGKPNKPLTAFSVAIETFDG